jgi:hypothetical protein
VCRIELPQNGVHWHRLGKKVKDKITSALNYLGTLP